MVVIYKLKQTMIMTINKLWKPTINIRTFLQTGNTYYLRC